DVQHVDIDYMDRKLDFTLSSSFQNLSVLINQMKKNGMRFILILDPAISGNETHYLTFTRGQENNVFIKWPDSNDIVWGKVWPDLPNVNVDGSLDHETQVKLYRAYVAFPDFLRSSTAAWWKKEIEELYSNPREPGKSLKFDGLWIDMNEPSNFVDGSVKGCRNEILNKPPYMPYLEARDGGLSSKTLCMESEQILPDGSRVQHYDVHSLYGWSQTRPTYEAVQEVTGERGIVITRSTFPSSGRWSGHWLGDNTAAWDQLEKSIIGMMEFSLFGIPYTGADICGFFGDAEYEMCIRWMQLGAFYPFSRNHNNVGTRRQDPVAWNSTFEEYSRKVLETRYSLLPYLYTLMHKAHAEGSTVIRALLHEFTDDSTTWDIDQQFMLGPALLISPVLQSNTFEIRAYFPRGRWYDYSTGSGQVSIGEWKILAAPLDHINLHVRGGSILPWQEPAMNTHYSRQNFVGLTVALDDKGKAEGQMFWDDGQSIDTYEKGNYFLANFIATEDTLKIQVLHNQYLSESNPLKVGYIRIWGLNSSDVAQVSFTYNNEQFIENNFTSDPYNQKLTIQLTEKNVNLEELTEVAWVYGNPELPTPTTTSVFPSSPHPSATSTGTITSSALITTPDVASTFPTTFPELTTPFPMSPTTDNTSDVISFTTTTPETTTVDNTTSTTFPDVTTTFPTSPTTDNTSDVVPFTTTTPEPTTVDNITSTTFPDVTTPFPMSPTTDNTSDVISLTTTTPEPTTVDNTTSTTFPGVTTTFPTSPTTDNTSDVVPFTTTTPEPTIVDNITSTTFPDVTTLFPMSPTTDNTSDVVPFTTTNPETTTVDNITSTTFPDVTTPFPMSPTTDNTSDVVPFTTTTPETTSVDNITSTTFPDVTTTFPMSPTTDNTSDVVPFTTTTPEPATVENITSTTFPDVTTPFPMSPTTDNTSNVISFTTTTPEPTTVDNTTSTTFPDVTTPFPMSPTTDNTSDVVPFTTTTPEPTTVENATSTTFPDVTTPFPMSPTTDNTSDVVPFTTTTPEPTTVENATSTTFPDVTTPFPMSPTTDNTSDVVPFTTTTPEPTTVENATSPTFPDVTTPFPMSPTTDNTSDVVPFTTTTPEPTTVENATSTTFPDVTTPFPMSPTTDNTSDVVPFTTTTPEPTTVENATSPHFLM
ncbi:hypothetical protein STEG23_035759, partial [Scotinomys teguina]